MMTMDDEFDQGKKPLTPFEKAYEESLNSSIKKLEEESLNMDLLFNVLDAIEENEPDNLPNKLRLIPYLNTVDDKTEVNESVQYHQLGLVKYLYHHTIWSGLSTTNFQSDKYPRPRLCITCKSISCVHIRADEPLNVEGILNQAIENCTHNIDPEIEVFEMVCARCVLESCGARSTIVDIDLTHIRVLWDEMDIMDFFNRTEKIRADEFKVN